MSIGPIGSAGSGSWRRPMRGRDTAERHRASTSLELLFDLCFVVAIGLAATQLSTTIVEGDARNGVLSYLEVFFAIWWAWMNFSWFASAYDTDDVAYRVMALIKISGVLVLAAGVPAVFHDTDLRVVTAGYCIMRLAMVGQWIRAAVEHPEGRPAAVRYAAGIFVVQLGWIARLALPEEWASWGFLVLVVAELSVPVWAERVRGTPWHSGHIAERYGLFTIIVLGEVVLAATTAVQSALKDTAALDELIIAAASGLLIVFAMWWLYFDLLAESPTTGSRGSTTFVWGYAHYFVFASAAAVGAGLEVIIDMDTGHTHLSAGQASAALAVPLAVFLACLWFLRASFHPGHPFRHAAILLGAALVLLTLTTPVPLPLIAGVITLLTVGHVVVRDNGR
ncbi:low temperature requirement protein A [Spiractinospora alimapuensis]|uniref:low temperature requirement protein A n=1 Tax=Spiractinospora alimapuensis TaxID=2820884 RepID=UPI001F236BD7|nr:low temperature requirement protein A [Spiractinospora alimapuensis]QVQ52598.1 low temperature requirement protein A [Spiractinospora alimapuensis]